MIMKRSSHIAYLRVIYLGRAELTSCPSEELRTSSGK